MKLLAIGLSLAGCEGGSSGTLDRDDASAEVRDAGDDSGEPSPTRDAGPEAGSSDARVEDAVAAAPEADAAGDAQSEPTALPEVEYRGGSRLTAKFYETEAERLFRHFFDNELGVRCTFHGSTTTPPRCLPMSRAQFAYRDAQCKGQLLLVYVAEPRCEEKYVAVVDGCSTRVVERGAPIPQGQAETTYVRDSDGGCVPVPRSTGELLYDSTDVALSRFVSARELHAGSGTLRARYMLAEDGSIAREGWYDATWDLPCTMGRTVGGEMRCIPNTEELFSLPGSLDRCPGPEIYSRPVCEPDRGLRKWRLEPQEPIDWRLVRVSEPVRDAHCESYPGASAFASVEPVPSESLGMLSPDRAGTRLLAASEVAAGHRAYVRAAQWGETQALFDEQLGIHCTPLRDADGVLRCMPPREGPYLDDRCSMSAVYLDEAPTSASGTRYLAIEDLTSRPDACSWGRVRVYEAGAAVAVGSPVFYLYDGECRATQPPSRENLFRPGREVPGATFVELMEVDG